MLKPLILVIEDDAGARGALAAVLVDWGADILQSDGAEEPETLVGARAGELLAIITDFHLGPGRDGVTLSARLRRVAPQARVLVLSGEVGGGARAAAARQGFDFIVKPASAESIIAWLARREGDDCSAAGGR
jgi:DNA-binding NtrC family response regulator